MIFPRCAIETARFLIKSGAALDAPAELLDDLRLLRDVDDAGRVPGAPVEGLDEALEYLEGLENESYLA